MRQEKLGLGNCKTKDERKKMTREKILCLRKLQLQLHFSTYLHVHIFVSIICCALSLENLKLFNSLVISSVIHLLNTILSRCEIRTLISATMFIHAMVCQVSNDYTFFKSLDSFLLKYCRKCCHGISITCQHFLCSS